MIVAADTSNEVEAIRPWGICEAMMFNFFDPHVIVRVEKLDDVVFLAMRRLERLTAGTKL